MKIIIGSENKAKITAVEKIFECPKLKVISVNAPSNVSEQPFSDEETITGAINRARESLKIETGHIGIGLEGGVVPVQNSLYVCNWGALVTVENSEPIIAGGARIRLPNEVAERLWMGEELGPIMDDFTKQKNIRQKEGAIGIFTNGLIDRIEMFSHIVKLLKGQYEFSQKIKKGFSNNSN